MVGSASLSEGMLVRHPKKSEWGLGKVLVVGAGSATVFFKDDPADHRIFLLDRTSLDIAEIQSDPTLDNLPPFVNGTFATKNKKVTMQDGIEEFKRRFPLGFEDPRYLGGKSVGVVGERNYKLRGHERYLEAFGDGRGEALLAAGKFDELRDQAHAVATKGKMNLLSPYEAMAFRDGLAASDTVAAEFFGALFSFVTNGPNQQGFNALANAVNDIPVKKGGSRAATWPIQTLLPFLADPARFMFLKPEPTKACADRLRFDLHYDSALRWATYEQLLKMGTHLLKELRPLGARDFIDAQSFMWVIEKY
jgi:hypothetical protein